MARQTVSVTRLVPRPVDEAWAILSDFQGLWHPAISTSRIQIENGAVTRHFRAADGGTYRERLTYLSHSAHAFRYVLTEGIPGIQGYEAEVTARPEGRRTEVTWNAEITGPKARIKAVAEGSKAIFALGLDTLKDAAPPAQRPPTEGAARVERLCIDGPLRLSVLATPGAMAGPDTLVLCLHGIGGQAQNWQPQLEALGDNYPMAALDMRGYGDSDLGLRPAAIDDLCGDILTVATTFSASRLILVGLSLGSWLATSFAMRHPERLAGLVLAGGCTGMSEAPARERKAFLDARLMPLDAGQGPADFAPEVVKIIAGPKAGRDLRTTLRASMAAIPAQAYRDALVAFANPTERFDFARIHCPVLMMTGDHDRLAPPEEISGVAKRILDARGKAADLRFERLSGAGHVCNLERPEAFNRHLDAFLARCLPKPGRKSQGAKKQALHRRILAAALAEFAAASFDGASMDRIAATAETSKPTLYRHFTSKEGLFQAVLDQGRGHILTPLADTDGAMIDQLWDFAWTYADFVLRPDMLSLARLILGEAERHPVHTRLYHQAGPGQALAGIRRYLDAERDRGRLTFEDGEMAAQHLWSLILSGPRDFHLHHVDAQPDRGELCRAVTLGLAAFLRAYSTRVDRDLRILDGCAQDLARRLSA